MSKRHDMKERIQQVALELFTEQGYDKTSLREIAERLEVSKAALYYHFKSKEEILLSITAGVVTGMDELLEWGESQPHSREFREEFLRRTAALVSDQLQPLIRFVQANSTVMKNINHEQHGDQARSRIRRIRDLICDPEDSLSDQLHGFFALSVLFVGPVLANLLSLEATADQLSEASLAAALEIISSRQPLISTGSS
jgi:AcrR family transcriptional regulator